MSLRTHYCGDLRAGDSGSRVSVCGWVDRRREQGKHLAFIDLRDHTGVIQCVVDDAHDLRSEYVVRVQGTVRARPDGTANPALATGEVEIGDCEVEVLSVAAPPPFPITDRIEADESVRLRHRYLDLRRPVMQGHLRRRATISSALRRSMDDQGFVEVETPLLIASTPEGARDFVVPSRLQPGSFYALPQSPQLFKQLLMVGGIDRYYQLARCLRDEDLRADRQFEFTQLDIEAAFVGADDVMDFVSQAVRAAVQAATGEELGDVPHMTWHDAQERFGTDKPDIRFGMELLDLTELFAETEFRALQPPSVVKGIRVPGEGDATRARLDRLTDNAKKAGAAGLVWGRIAEGGEVDSPVAKFLSDEERTALLA
nr:aspartate--tRNA ligase [Actinomycetota bacterium]